MVYSTYSCSSSLPASGLRSRTQRMLCHGWKANCLSHWQTSFSRCSSIIGIGKKSTNLLTALNDLQSQEIHDINEAIKEGNPPPKCKKMDLIKRLAGSPHIFNYIASKLLEGIQPGPPPQRITEHSVAAAEKLTAFADSQKQIATEVRILSMWTNSRNTATTFSICDLEDTSTQSMQPPHFIVILRIQLEFSKSIFE